MVVLLAALLLLGCSSCSTATHGGAVGHPDGSRGPALLSRSELVMVLPSSDSRMVLIEASRPWRLGIRTYVPTNATHPAVKALNRHKDSRRHLETYAHMPDEMCNRSSKLKPCECAVTGPVAFALQHAAPCFLSMHAMGVERRGFWGGGMHSM